MVLHHAHEAEEFFAPLLKHGEHIIRLPVGDGQAKASLRETALIDTLRRLRANETLAARMAAAAGTFATRWLSHAAVLAYTRTLLTKYGKLYQSKVELEPGYSRIESAEDVQSAWNKQSEYFKDAVSQQTSIGVQATEGVATGTLTQSSQGSQE